MNEPSSERPISVAVIGAGAFGRNHARVYDELAKSREATTLNAIVDHDLTRAEVLAREFNCAAYASVDDLLAQGKINAASVAVPTIHHSAVARQLMQAGVDVLIEKPITTSL